MEQAAHEGVLVEAGDVPAEQARDVRGRDRVTAERVHGRVEAGGAEDLGRRRDLKEQVGKRARAEAAHRLLEGADGLLALVEG